MYASYIGLNVVLLFSMVGLAFVLRFNVMLEKRARRYLFGAILLSCVLLVAEALEVYMHSLATPNFWHYLSSGLSLGLRPLLLFSVGVILFEVRKRDLLLISLPAFLNLTLCVISMFVPVVFGLDAENLYFPGPLSFIPAVVGTSYAVIFIFFSIRKYYRKRNLNILIFPFIGVAVLGATIIEWLTEVRMITGTAVVCLIFFYNFLVTAQFRYDALTASLNRSIYNMEARDRDKEITGALVLDVNGLKMLNDEKGHTIGDEALITVASVCDDLAGPGFRFYRFGGDEFIMLCFKKTEAEIKALSCRITESLEKTPYRAAVGYALREKDEPFECMIHRADHAMYENKAECKCKNHNRE